MPRKQSLQNGRLTNVYADRQSCCRRLCCAESLLFLSFEPEHLLQVLQKPLSAHATLRQPTGAHRPPRHGLAAARRTRLEALLHRVGERPPAARLRIRGNGSHVCGVVRAGVHKVRDEERERRVVVDRVLRDVVRGERGEHVGPARARRVQSLVLGDGRGLELCAGPCQRLGM
jgi:hypothetical protein